MLGVLCKEVLEGTPVSRLLMIQVWEWGSWCWIQLLLRIQIAKCSMSNQYGWKWSNACSYSRCDRGLKKTQEWVTDRSSCAGVWSTGVEVPSLSFLTWLSPPHVKAEGLPPPLALETVVLFCPLLQARRNSSGPTSLAHRRTPGTWATAVGPYTR